MRSWAWESAVSGKAAKRTFAVSLVGTFCLCLVALLAGMASAPAGAQTVTELIPTFGNNSQNIAVNPLTNRIYVTNFSSANVTVFDATTNRLLGMVTTGQNPSDVAVN